MIAELRSIDPSCYDPKRADWLWEHVQRQKFSFDDYSRNRADLFAARLLTPTSVFFEYKDSGLVTVEQIVPRLSACIHFFMWDPEIHEKEVVTVGREVISQVLETFQLHRITANPPSFNRFAARVAVRCGFRYEGTARQCLLYEGRYLDCEIYGLLAHEFQQMGG